MHGPVSTKTHGYEGYYIHTLCIHACISKLDININI